MTDNKAIELAQQYLSSKGIGYLLPGHIGRQEGNTVEVVFDAPGTEDPIVAVIDPPDVRLLVNTIDETVEEIYQM